MRILFLKIINKGGKDTTVEPPVMKKVTVETFGVEYPEPNKM